MKEIKQSVNWSVGWIAYRYKELSAVIKSSKGLKIRRNAEAFLLALRKHGEKVMKGWV